VDLPGLRSRVFQSSCEGGGVTTHSISDLTSSVDPRCLSSPIREGDLYIGVGIRQSNEWSRPGEHFFICTHPQANFAGLTPVCINAPHKYFFFSFTRVEQFFKYFPHN